MPQSAHESVGEVWLGISIVTMLTSAEVKCTAPHTQLARALHSVHRGFINLKRAFWNAERGRVAVGRWALAAASSATARCGRRGAPSATAATRPGRTWSMATWTACGSIWRCAARARTVAAAALMGETCVVVHSHGTA